MLFTLLGNFGDLEFRWATVEGLPFMTAGCVAVLRK